MLPRRITKCVVPVVRVTAFTGPTAGMGSRNLPSTFAPLPSPLMQKTMPTLLIDNEVLQNLTCGTGQPAQRGRRKPLVWKRRQPWFDHQWSLDLKRVKKGPETPHFPDGVPFTQIRAFQSYAGRSWKINAGRRRKIRLSLKRGRRKLL